jgi:hypothetical protein
MSLSKRFLIAGLMFFCALSAHGQAAKSIFSSFGVGDMWEPAQANVQGMGGVGLSNPQYWYINNINPALLVFNKLTTFHAGVAGDWRRASNGNESEKNYGGNMNYLMLAFPIKLHRWGSYPSRWTSSVSLTPYSTVNYGYSYSQPIENTTGTATFIEKGSGGINQLSWSNGFSLTKYLSVGVRANYLFSSIENDFGKSVKLADDQLILLTTNTLKRYNYKDFQFAGAASLHLDSLGTNNYRYNLGAVYTMDANVTTDYFELLERYTQNGTLLAQDTIVGSRLGNTFIPGNLAVGMSFGKAETWAFGVDARVTDFTEFTAFEKKETPVGQGWKVAAGLEVTPDPTSMGSYVKRMTFRTGVSLEESPYLANNNPLRDFGINFGFSAPVSRFSSVDLAFRWGKRGNIGLNTIEEEYFKIYFGVTFNDKWFIKRRFD